MNNWTKKVFTVFFPSVVSRESVSEIINSIPPGPVLIYISKSRTAQCFWQNGLSSVTVGLFWILMAFGAWTQPADGAEPSNTELNESLILSPGGPGAAISLKAGVRCDPVKVTGTARLSWKVASPPGTQQRVDMTMFRDGFQTGNFMTLGPVPSDQSEMEFNSGEPGINYAWRVLTLTGEGWVPSEPARLPWPACPVDRRAQQDMD